MNDSSEDSKRNGASPPVFPPSWFDEEAYLLTHEDVAAGVACGAIHSGYEHYVTQGWLENRSVVFSRQAPHDQLYRWGVVEKDQPLQGAQGAKFRCNIELAVASEGGGLFVSGWIDDLESPLDTIRIVNSNWMFIFSVSDLVRVRRADVEKELGASHQHSYGFFGFCNTGDPLVVESVGCSFNIQRQDGSAEQTNVNIGRIGDVELRDLVLNYFAQASFYGNRQVEAIRACGSGFGAQIAGFNRDVSRRLVRGAYTRNFGGTRPLRGSLMVCLYGKAEFVFLQNALFSGRPGFQDYEIIWVSNSPDLSERLLAEIEIAHSVYGVPQTAVLLPGNAGFGAANNAAASFAHSDRVIAINPDVFPKDLAWARKHTDLVDGLPAEQTRLFGAPLYYDDGSLMHGGMYFEFDTGVSLKADSVEDCRLVRVEHYGKGAPAASQRFTRPRPVPAVTGAFISCDRAWYEKLGGFSEDYIFGNYEDADLCLKSLQQGTPSWLHDLRLWHLEGKGSTRLPAHEGGWLVNRWLFADRWAKEIDHGLLGPNPTRLPGAGGEAVPSSSEDTAGTGN